MSARIRTCNSIDETHAAGRRIGSALVAGHVLALVGPLGSGKTTLMRGIADGAGVGDLRQVNSPTFVIVNEYDARAELRIYHIDVYRLGGSDDLEAIGFDEFCENGAVVIEWADRVPELLPADHLAITLEPVSDTIRRLEAKATGPNAEALLAKL